MRNKKIVLILSVLLIFVAAWFLFLKDENKNIVPEKGFVYIDKDRGYTINLPVDWTSLKVVDGSYHNQNFTLPTKNQGWLEKDKKGIVTKGYGTVFTIISFPLKDWIIMQKNCGERGSNTWGPGCYTDLDILGKNTTTIFVETWPSSGPGVMGDTEWETLAKEAQTNSYLKNNFSVSKK